MVVEAYQHHVLTCSRGHALAYCGLNWGSDRRGASDPIPNLVGGSAVFPLANAASNGKGNVRPTFEYNCCEGKQVSTRPALALYLSEKKRGPSAAEAQADNMVDTDPSGVKQFSGRLFGWQNLSSLATRVARRFPGTVTLLLLLPFPRRGDRAVPASRCLLDPAVASSSALRREDHLTAARPGCALLGFRIQESYWGSTPLNRGRSKLALRAGIFSARCDSCH